MVTSPREWKILGRDIKQYATNQHKFWKQPILYITITEVSGDSLNWKAYGVVSLQW